MKPGEALLNKPIAWGRKLIEAQDHDPLYVGLANWKVDRYRVRRYLLAYWCCYDVGASWRISLETGNEYWDLLETAAINESGPRALGIADEERWPRAHERRHWRGQKCVDSVAWLRARFPDPEEAVMGLENASSLAEVEKRMSEWPQFGPWIAFKAADMIERIFGREIEFPPTIMSMYRDPKKGAELAGEVLHASPEEVIDRMLVVYGAIPAPGYPGRACNIQEVETVLCKWKSARNGHYWIGLDTHDHRKKLELWGAKDLLASYPK